MGDERRVTDSTNERVQFEGRLKEALGKPEPQSYDWGVTASFVEPRDIIVLVGYEAEDEQDVVDSVLRAGIARGLIRSARSCGEDGAAPCVARCCKDGGIGCYVIESSDTPSLDEAFSPLVGCVVISVAPKHVETLADLFDDVDVPYIALGQVGGDRITFCAAPDDKTYVDLALDEL